MSNDQLLALFRLAATTFGGAAGAWLVSHGYLSATQWSSLSGALGSIFSIVLTTVAPIVISLWASWHVHSPVGRLEAAARLPDVAKIDMKPTDAGHALAAATPSDRVSVPS